MVGEGSHKLETGAGIVIGTIYDSHEWNHPEPPGAAFSIGYRYYPKDSNRVSFKATFTPTINRSGFHPGIGLSIGITLTPEGDASIPVRIE